MEASQRYLWAAQREMSSSSIAGSKDVARASSPGSRSANSHSLGKQRGRQGVSTATKPTSSRSFSPGSTLEPSARGMATTSLTDRMKVLPRQGKKLALRAQHRTIEVLLRWARNTRALGVAFVKDPRIVATWYVDIKEAVVHFLRWVGTGFRRFGADLRTSRILVGRVLSGYPLSMRERSLLVRTTNDCFKLIPFSFFIIVPFAELLLPVVLRLFPNMLPSTFFKQKYDNTTLARKYKAKEEMADFWQQVVRQRTHEIFESDDSSFANRHEELEEFQAKLQDAEEYPTLAEILRFSRLFQEELSIKNMTPVQLGAMARLLGLNTEGWRWPGHLRVQLRHHITQLRREDRDYLWEGIDKLTREELIDSCHKRAINFHDRTNDEMREDLARWLELSANNKEIPTTLLLWIQSFYLSTAKDLEQDQEVKSSLKMPHTSLKDPEPDPDSDLFHDMADRQKAYAESAERQLEQLQNEIKEVLEGEKADKAAEAGEPNGDEETKGAESSKPKQERVPSPSGVAMEEEQEEKARVLKRIRELDDMVRLYKDVSLRQKELIDEQLKFLNKMRNNKPNKQRDADVVLLDQRIRLHEIIGTFERNMEEIEAVLGDRLPTQQEKPMVNFDVLQEMSRLQRQQDAMKTPML